LNAEFFIGINEGGRGTERFLWRTIIYETSYICKYTEKRVHSRQSLAQLKQEYEFLSVLGF
jgi:hypothetical protein